MPRFAVGTYLCTDCLRQAKELYDQHLGPGVFYEEGWRHIVTEHGGRLPLLIRAVPEGTVVDYKNGDDLSQLLPTDS